MQLKKIYYYHALDEDMIKNAGQDYKLPSDYKWINNGKLHTIVFDILYAMVKFIAGIYCRFFIRVQFIGKEAIDECRGRGCFVYANHTQVFGDVVIPSIVAGDHRGVVVVSPANLGIPVIGKLLPGLGALPIPNDRKRMNEFFDSLKTMIAKGRCVFIYPEAHVWPYYTGIRPFSTSSFHYPIELDAPVFSMTMTYQKRSNGRPKIVCYIDRCDPPVPEDANKRKRISALHCSVYSRMQARSSQSNYEYCKYIKMEEEGTP